MDWGFLKNSDIESPKTWLQTLEVLESHQMQIEEKDQTSATDIFFRYFDSGILEYIAEETNKYARQKLQKPNLSNRESQWKEINKDDILRYMIVLLIMSIIDLPTIAMYWEESYMFSTCVSRLISRNQFQNITKYLHLADDYSTTPILERNRISKIEPFLEKLINKWQINFETSKVLVIDECVAQFKGRILFLQYNPMKHHKWGLKFFALADSRTCYLYKVILYTGKQFPLSNNTTLATEAVLSLLSGDEYKGKEIFMDNFYTSTDLFNYLEMNKIGATGTVNARKRCFSPLLKPIKLKKGEKCSFIQGNNTIVAWKDKRLVTMISNIYTGNLMQRTVRGKHKMKPEMIFNYNDNKHGLDKVDQMLSYNSYSRKNYKWWHAIFYYLFDITIINASIVYFNDSSASKTSSKILSFRSELVDELMTMLLLKSCKSLKITHYPFVLSSKDKKECAWCQRSRESGKKNVTRTIYKCLECNKHLCPFPCFSMYHNS